MTAPNTSKKSSFDVAKLSIIEDIFNKYATEFNINGTKLLHKCNNNYDMLCKTVSYKLYVKLFNLNDGELKFATTVKNYNNVDKGKVNFKFYFQANNYYIISFNNIPEINDVEISTITECALTALGYDYVDKEVA